jgi:hypothetical protein
MSRRRIMIAVLVAAVLFPMLIAPVQAHHSNANYDSAKTVTLKGTVVDYDWGNPHVIMVWDVKDKDTGKVVRWEAFLASVETELANGLRKNTFKPGDPVIMTVHAAKDGSPHSVAAEVRRGDGTVVCAPCVGQHLGGGSAHPLGVE